jgi:hypothetical protein
MFPSALTTALIALGGVCVIISLTIFHYFKDRVDTYTYQEMKDLFSSRETALFIKGIKEGKVTSSMLHDFSGQLFESFKPRQWLKALWAYFPVSGIFFISAGIIGSFADTNPIVDYSVYSTLIVGIAFFLSGILQLVRLGKRLM